MMKEKLVYQYVCSQVCYRVLDSLLLGIGIISFFRQNFKKRIELTLGEGEMGIFSIRAYHDILSRLPEDIQVVQVKDAARLSDYRNP